jgi:ABC-type phosphate transport system ATPase subunit
MIRNMIVVASVLLFVGCGGAGESPLLSGMTIKMLPDLQQEAKVKKTVLTEGQKCLHKAKNITEANSCNAAIRAKDPEFEMDDFTQWTDKEKGEVDTVVKKYVTFFDCILNAKTVTAAAECKEP